MSADKLYGQWQHAARVRHYASLYGTEDQAEAREQAAWDAFRDACEVENPGGTCAHPECPQVEDEPTVLCVTCDTPIREDEAPNHEGHQLLRAQTLIDGASSR